MKQPLWLFEVDLALTTLYAVTLVVPNIEVELPPKSHKINLKGRGD